MMMILAINKAKYLLVRRLVIHLLALLLFVLLVAICSRFFIIFPHSTIVIVVAVY